MNSPCVSLRVKHQIGVNGKGRKAGSNSGNHIKTGIMRKAPVEFIQEEQLLCSSAPNSLRFSPPICTTPVYSPSLKPKIPLGSSAHVGHPVRCQKHQSENNNKNTCSGLQLRDTPISLYAAGSGHVFLSSHTGYCFGDQGDNNPGFVLQYYSSLLLYYTRVTFYLPNVLPNYMVTLA